MAATQDVLVEKLTAQGNGEEAKFLNDIVAQMWPNINVAGSKMIKDIADPMFATMLPGPLASLHFTKVDLGTVPLRISNVLATKTETRGIKLDLNVDWDGKCDIELDGKMIPKLGVKGAKLKGRLSVLLCPLTNIIPLIGAAQVSFINPPTLELDFSGAAAIADLSVIDGAVRKVILSIIASMAVLPNRFLVTMDPANDYFITHLYPLGIIRITVERAWGFAEQAKTATKKFFSKLTRASPDCYAKVEVGAEPMWKTTTKANTTTPTWNETYDFVVTDYDQCIRADIMDSDVGEDHEVGLAVTTVKEILLAGGKHELPLVRKGEETEGKVSLSCEYFELTDDGASFSASEHSGQGKLCGIATILISTARGIQGEREKLKPSVKVSWGTKHHFQTAIKSDYPGTDIHNPTFDQPFRIPVSADMVGSSAEKFRIALLDEAKEVGGVDVPYEEVLKAPGMILQKSFDVGGGASVRVSIRLQGVRAASTETKELARR